ncbi:hypothetical protein NX023_04875, partial [Cytobacillus firmus]|nr:hypothetical protein [Cytobacillus firmus]
MERSWRPFPGFPSVFRLHEAVMATFSLLSLSFLGSMKHSWRSFLCSLFVFGLHEAFMTTFSRL